MGVFFHTVGTMFLRSVVACPIHTDQTAQSMRRLFTHSRTGESSGLGRELDAADSLGTTSVARGASPVSRLHGIPMVDLQYSRSPALISLVLVNIGIRTRLDDASPDHGNIYRDVTSTSSVCFSMLANSSMGTVFTRHASHLNSRSDIGTILYR